MDRHVAEEYADHFSQKPILVGLINLGTGSFQMSWSHTEVYHSSRHLTMYEIYRPTNSQVPSNVLETSLQQNHSNAIYLLKFFIGEIFLLLLLK